MYDYIYINTKSVKIVHLASLLLFIKFLIQIWLPHNILPLMKPWTTFKVLTKTITWYAFLPLKLFFNVFLSYKHGKRKQKLNNMLQFWLFHFRRGQWGTKARILPRWGRFSNQNVQSCWRKVCLLKYIFFSYH